MFSKDLHNKIKLAIKQGRVEWQRHALARMMERGLSREAVKQALLTGTVIEEYPDYKPFPGLLVLGWDHGLPVHVVCAFAEASGYCFVITAYRPDLDHFEQDFRKRKN